MGSFGDSRSRIGARKGEEEATNYVDAGTVNSIEACQDRKDIFLSDPEVGECLYRYSRKLSSSICTRPYWLSCCLPQG